jgi:hypothetical protein
VIESIPEIGGPAHVAAYVPRDLAEQTLDGVLPYEETWRENAQSRFSLFATPHPMRWQWMWPRFVASPEDRLSLVVGSGKGSAKV